MIASAVLNGCRREDEAFVVSVPENCWHQTRRRVAAFSRLVPFQSRFPDFEEILKCDSVTNHQAGSTKIHQIACII